MPPEKIGQNFTINQNGQIVFRGQILPPREGITPILPNEKIKVRRKIPRWYRGSYQTEQQATDELYTKDNQIA